MRILCSTLALALLGAVAQATTIVNYTEDCGETNNQPLNGLAAQAEFSVSGTTLTILLTNTSTGVPSGFAVADSLLVSLGFNLPAGVGIASGDTAVVGFGSQGLGDWSARTGGSSVAEEWLWTNDFGGDLMDQGQALESRQVISTSDGQGGGTSTLFGGGAGNVDGPFGGIASSPPQLAVPANQHAVSDSILFNLTLSSTLTQAELDTVAAGSVVEYGSDVRYLCTPEPAVLALLALGLVVRRR